MSPIRSILLPCLACMACLALAPLAGSAQTKAPRNAVALESSSSPDNGTQISFASATLRKGKKGRVLRVDFRVRFEDVLNFTITGGASVRVNGVSIDLTYGAEGATCGPTGLSCTVDGYGWLDLDAAEETSPGVFLGQPLEIEVSGSVDAQNRAEIDVSLLAQLLRK